MVCFDSVVRVLLCRVQGGGDHLVEDPGKPVPGPW